MPTDKKVSVGWQIVFTFLPIVNFWAFYRIRKLRKYVLYVIVPQIVLSVIIGVYTSSLAVTELDDFGIMDPEDPFDMSFYSHPVIISSYGISIALQGLTIYLIVVWSRQHNQQFGQPTVQPSA